MFELGKRTIVNDIDKQMVVLAFAVGTVSFMFS